MESNPAIVAIFGQPPVNINLAATQVSRDNAAVLAMLCLGVVAVILRFITRLALRNPFRVDDWLILVSLVCMMGIVAGGTFGAGRHVWAVTLPDLTSIFKDLSFRLPIILGFTLALSYPIIVWVAMGNSCRPVSYFWNQFNGASGTCIKTDTFFLATAIINMVNDIVVLAVPFPQIAKLQMNRRKKLAVCAILALGSFVCVASAVRIYVLYQFTQARDVTWMMGPVFIWSSIEPSVAIVCARLPHLAPLARLAHLQLLSTRGGKSGQPTSPSLPWRSRRSGDPNVATVGSRPSQLAAGRFDRPGLERSEDEIRLTSKVTASTVVRSRRSLDSAPEDRLPGQFIVVQSSFEQSASNAKHGQ
ncbi:hypothetical protein BO94DRAFT_613741 [Aspergillus sclerotioniger CBS 115572]|uniref:Rhodopsin domain-containing protein n=1 Tax=Aspergillus sclerotioniger CBS 115572 TaxID=1450535 RepID=A0A317UY48_9EURO|nr:hypothetical protein BO94DRAFT_613741 [Aspergillus sclerotioniger CBS 115572]PWY66516.1 hypothetical protein BO94DRAFT_613741 [Aspergillus sclerotioniger CBS 115572]